MQVMKLLYLEKNYVYIVIYENIEEDLVNGATLKTRGGSAPSDLDADGWRRLLASNSYGTVNIDLRKTFPEVIKKISY